MKARINKNRKLVITPETEKEKRQLEIWLIENQDVRVKSLNL